MTQTLIFSTSRSPHVPGVEPQEEDYVQIGVEIGIDEKKIARMWQALSNLALHARLPKNKNDHIQDYGDRKAIRAKVEEVVAELERLAKGTMKLSGVPAGGDVTFDCTCGAKNKRRAKLLRDGQHVFCINPKCDETWKVVIDGSETNFENVLVDVPCKVCGTVNHIPWRMVTKMKYDEIIQYPCIECKGTNAVKWHLMQASFPPKPD